MVGLQVFECMLVCCFVRRCAASVMVYKTGMNDGVWYVLLLFI
jgi:hypothetical protein